MALMLLASCTQENPDIRVACVTNPYVGNYQIKWEIFPPMKGIVRIYESSTPDSFNLYSPFAEVDIETGYKDIFSLRTLDRIYFKLVFNRQYSVITSERTVALQSLYNFRDLGGYYNENNKQTQWGKLYRSSSLSNATRQDIKVLDNLRIKTIIDFRTKTERFLYPYRYQASQVFSLPLRGNPNPVPLYFDQILSGKIKTGDVVSYKNDVHSFILENNRDYFENLFDILTEPNNYPIVMNCLLGNDRSGIVSALVLFALGIDLEQVLNDWLLSDELIDYNSILTNTEMYSDDILETLTAMYRTSRETFSYPFEKITKEYGSMDKFLESECGMTVEKRKKLREILLYP
jgi:protein-tyrosine phosphatase